MAHATSEPMLEGELRDEWDTMSEDPKDWGLSPGFKKGSKNWGVWLTCFVQRPGMRTRLAALAFSADGQEAFRKAVTAGLYHKRPNPCWKWGNQKDKVFCDDMEQILDEYLRADACPGFDSTDLRAVRAGTYNYSATCLPNPRAVYRWEGGLQVATGDPLAVRNTHVWTIGTAMGAAIGERPTAFGVMW